MKNKYFIILSLFLTAQFIKSQVTANSNKFSVTNYLSLDNNGQYSAYTTHGFYENVAPGTVARVFILPILKFDLEKIKYIDNKGNETHKSATEIRTLIIPVKQELDLPNESQKASICAAIRSTKISSFYQPILKNTTGQPILNPFLASNLSLNLQLFLRQNLYTLYATFLD